MFPTTPPSPPPEINYDNVALSLKDLLEPSVDVLTEIEERIGQYEEMKREHEANQQELKNLLKSVSTKLKPVGEQLTKLTTIQQEQQKTILALQEYNRNISDRLFRQENLTATGASSLDGVQKKCTSLEEESTTYMLTIKNLKLDNEQLKTYVTNLNSSFRKLCGITVLTLTFFLWYHYTRK